MNENWLEEKAIGVTTKEKADEKKESQQVMGKSEEQSKNARKMQVFFTILIFKNFFLSQLIYQLKQY